MIRFLILFSFILLSGCEIYYVNKSEVTISGKYVVTALDITNVDQATEKDSLYKLGSVYLAKRAMPDPFDSIRINRFYIHMTEASIRLNLLGVDNFGRDVWQYGNSPNEIFYRVFGNTAFFSGYLQFTYLTKDKYYQTMTFIIEHDGLETIQLRSSGSWARGKEGQKQVMTLFLTRVGP
jgi:hypothetical protein